jgi:hypothetical protein
MPYPTAHPCMLLHRSFIDRAMKDLAPRRRSQVLDPNVISFRNADQLFCPHPPLLHLIDHRIIVTDDSHATRPSNQPTRPSSTTPLPLYSKDRHFTSFVPYPQFTKQPPENPRILESSQLICTDRLHSFLSIERKRRRSWVVIDKGMCGFVGAGRGLVYGDKGAEWVFSSPLLSSYSVLTHTSRLAAV